MRPERQLGFLWGGTALLLIALAPFGDRLVSALPGCPVKAVFDLPCPSCGSTRAALALAELDVLAAIAISPLAAAAWMMVVVGGVVAGVMALLDRSPREPEWRLTLTARWLLGLVILANWVYLVGVGA